MQTNSINDKDLLNHINENTILIDEGFFTISRNILTNGDISINTSGVIFLAALTSGIVFLIKFFQKRRTEFIGPMLDHVKLINTSLSALKKIGFKRSRLISSKLIAKNLKDFARAFPSLSANKEKTFNSFVELSIQLKLAIIALILDSDKLQKESLKTALTVNKFTHMKSNDPDIKKALVILSSVDKDFNNMIDIYSQDFNFVDAAKIDAQEKDELKKVVNIHLKDLEERRGLLNSN